MKDLVSIIAATGYHGIFLLLILHLPFMSGWINTGRTKQQKKKKMTKCITEGIIKAPIASSYIQQAVSIHPLIAPENTQELLFNRIHS